MVELAKAESLDDLVPPETTAFVGLVDNLFLEFVTTDKDGVIKVPSLGIWRKGERTKISVSGKRNEDGVLKEAELVIIRKIKGKKKRLTMIADLSGENSYHDMPQALLAMQSVSEIYKRSNLPRQKAA